MIFTREQRQERENYIKEFVRAREGKTDPEWKYINSQNKVSLVCEKGHAWKSFWGHLKNDHWCPECAGQRVHEQDVRVSIEKKGGKLDPNWTYVNEKQKFWILCEKGHRWETNLDSLKNKKTWCPYCIGHRVLEKEAIDFIKSKDGTVQPGWKYISSTDKFWITCSKGHSWETHWNVIQAGHWCPHCKIFNKEREFRSEIEKILGIPFPSRRPEWLRYPETNRPLELDGYNESKGIAFEFQGEQHYIDGRFNKKTNLVDIQKRDQFKKETCEKKGIKLLIVPYWISKEDWKKEITNNLFKG